MHGEITFFSGGALITKESIITGKCKGEGQEKEEEEEDKK